MSEPFGAPDLLLNAAGINLREPVGDVTLESWRRTLGLNLSVPFFLTRVLAPGMIERGSGAVINIAFDIVIDAYGGEATRGLASRAVRPGGVIAHIGLASGAGGLDVRRMTLQEVTFIGTYTYTMTDFRKTFEAMVAGRLGTFD